MVNRKIKWLIYTVLVGLIPFMSRLVIFIASSSRTIDFLFNAADFIALGLVLHISNINELEHLENENKTWKTVQNGISIIFIAVYGMLYAISLIAQISPSVFDVLAIKISSIILSIVSALISYSIYDRLSKVSAGGEG